MRPNNPPQIVYSIGADEQLKGSQNEKNVGFNLEPKSKKRVIKEKRKRKKKEQSQLSLSDSQYNPMKLEVIDEIGESRKLEQKINSLKKSKSKRNKKSTVPAKIKVKNKFFSDISFQQQENQKKQDNHSERPTDQPDLFLNFDEKQQLNQIQIKPQLGIPEIVLDTKKSVSCSRKGVDYEVIQKKTDFIKARRCLQRCQEDIKSQKYLRNKLRQINEDVEEVTIGLQTPNIYRNRAVCQAMHLERIKSSGKSYSLLQSQPFKNKTQMSAQERRIEKKLLKNRNYFYSRLEENIKIRKERERNATDEQMKFQKKGQQ